MKTRERVQVRLRGRRRELRVDGTLASHFEPGRVATGSVWDAIAAPLLALPPERLRSVLILGLGGGSVARLVRSLAPHARIVGVERDPDVVRAARRHFGLDRLGVEIIVGDALSVLARERRRFDAVIEDVFVGVTQRLRKPDGFPQPGLARAWKRVRTGGLLISNTIHERAEVARVLRQLGGQVLLEVDVADYHNRILALGPLALKATRLRRLLAGHPVFSVALPKLSFKTVH